MPVSMARPSKHVQDKRTRLAAIRYVKKKATKAVDAVASTVAIAQDILPQTAKRLASQLSPRKLKEGMGSPRKKRYRGTSENLEARPVDFYIYLFHY